MPLASLHQGHISCKYPKKRIFCIASGKYLLAISAVGNDSKKNSLIVRLVFGEALLP